METVTLDTSAVDQPTETRLHDAGAYDNFEIAGTTVTGREQADGDFPVPPVQVMETAVWDESRLDECVLGDDQEPNRLEQILAVISSGSFPPPGKRDALTRSERRQLRDTMIIKHQRREKLETRFSTRIMTVDEFLGYASAAGSKAGNEPR